MDYGKRIVTESFHEGKKKSTKVEYSLPKQILDKSQALSEIMKALDLITTKQTHHLTVIIEADPKTHLFKLVTKKYIAEE